jgi:hypothetical protein
MSSPLEPLTGEDIGRPTQPVSGRPGSAVGLYVRLLDAGHRAPIYQHTIPAGRRQPLPAPATTPHDVSLHLPVPSGLFHAGHVPSDWPYRRAGCA